MSCRYKFLLALFLLLQSSQSFALPAIQLKKIAGGFNKPVYAASAKDGSGRLFVVEQRGLIYSIDPKDPSPKSRKIFLDIRKKVDIGVEKGLLSIAFHPQFKNNGRVFVDYTGRPAKIFSFISEFKVAPNADTINPKTEKVLIKIEQPSHIHKGGTLLFGPDGYLYISSGDGGPRLDPHNRGQSLNTLLGKILRIDVDHQDTGKKYAIPSDNPFVGQKNAKPEIFAYGLRNPWRFSIDPVTGFIFAGDVGQEAREEIDFIEKGKNYGWRVMEGNICTPEIKQKCPQEGLTPPLLDYRRDVGMTVVGGSVYRGKEFPSLQGIYFYADFVLGKIWGLRFDGKKILEQKLLLDTDFPISSLGQDEQGELYVVDYIGNIYQIIE